MVRECFLADDDDKPVPDGVIGEMLVRPRRANIMQLGYWRNPSATVQAWRNLWFHTGDYLRRDPDGDDLLTARKMRCAGLARIFPPMKWSWRCRVIPTFRRSLSMR